MAIGFNKRKTGLFGTGYNPPPLNQSPTMGDPGLGMQTQMPQKAGLGTRLLGQGWEDKAFALGGLLKGDGGPAEQYMQMRQYPALLAQQQAAAQAEDQRKRSLDMADWQAKYQYQIDHPKPVNNDTVNDVNWYMNASPEEKAAYHALHPQYQTIRNPDGTMTVVPIGNPAQLPTFTQEDWDKAGDGASNGTGGFR